MSDEEDTNEPAPIPSRELLYIIDLEAYVVPGKDSYYDTQTLLGKDAARNYLSSIGYSAAQVKAFINGMGYMKVRRFYADATQPQICRDPGGEQCINSYILPALQAKAGTYPSIVAILSYLTRGDDEGREWLLNWTAAKVQNPTNPLPTAVAFLGAAGTGKSTFVRIIMEMVGMKNCVSLGQHILASTFTSAWAGKCVVNVDEAFSGEDNVSLGYKVKRILTADDVEYHAKGRDPVWVKNSAAWVFTSNGLLAVREDEDDRRITSFVQSARPTAEYALMLKGLFNGTKPTAAFLEEIAAFKADLLERRVDTKRITSPYANADKKDIAELSRNSAEDFLTELTEYGLTPLIEEVKNSAQGWDDTIAFPKDGKDIETEDRVERSVVKASLYALYARYAKQYGQKAVNKNRFTATAKRFGMVEGRRVNNTRTMVVWWRKPEPA